MALRKPDTETRGVAIRYVRVLIHAFVSEPQAVMRLIRWG